MPQEIAVVGLVSDTHGLLRPEVLEALRGVDLIVHAGDVGAPAILDALKAVAPVVAVRGNIDRGDWASALPLTAIVEPASLAMYVIHDLARLNLERGAASFQVVVSGHSHKPAQSERSGVLFINPGSAGPRRFHLPVSVARLNLRHTPLDVEFIDLLGGLARFQPLPPR